MPLFSRWSGHAPLPGTRPLILGRSPLEPRTICAGLGFGALLAILGLLIGWPLTAATPLPAEQTFLGGVDATGNPITLTIARILGYVGHLAVAVTVSIVLAVFARRRWGDWALGLMLLVVFGGATTVTTVLKGLTTRTRPDGALVSTFTSAFPSGHVVRAVAVYGLIAWLVFSLTQRRTVRGLAVTAAVAIVVLNGAARIALGVHWPTDVFFGAIIGAAWLAISFALIRPRFARGQAPGAAESVARQPTGSR